jgi:hypothetical protein
MNSNTHPLEVVARSWMKELLAHVIVEAFPHLDEPVEQHANSHKNLHELH